MYVNNGAWYVVMSSTGSGTDRDIEEHSKIENGVWWEWSMVGLLHIGAPYKSRDKESK